MKNKLEKIRIECQLSKSELQMLKGGKKKRRKQYKETSEVTVSEETAFKAGSELAGAVQ